jgi:hypothetical protein
MSQDDSNNEKCGAVCQVLKGPLSFQQSSCFNLFTPAEQSASQIMLRSLEMVFIIKFSPTKSPHQPLARFIHRAIVSSPLPTSSLPQKYLAVLDSLLCKMCHYREIFYSCGHFYGRLMEKPRRRIRAGKRCLGFKEHEESLAALCGQCRTMIREAGRKVQERFA